MYTCSEADGEVFEKEHVALSDIIVKTGHCFSSQIFMMFLIRQYFTFRREISQQRSV